jgi:hypothetical protein
VEHEVHPEWNKGITSFTRITRSKKFSFCKAEQGCKLDVAFSGNMSTSTFEDDALDRTVVMNVHGLVRISIPKKGIWRNVFISIRNITE